MVASQTVAGFMTPSLLTNNSNCRSICQQSNCIGLIYNEFADNILNFLAKTIFGAFRINIAFDVYRFDSMKNAERIQRSMGMI